MALYDALHLNPVEALYAALHRTLSHARAHSPLTHTRLQVTLAVSTGADARATQLSSSIRAAFTIVRLYPSPCLSVSLVWMPSPWVSMVVDALTMISDALTVAFTKVSPPPPPLSFL